MILTGKAEEAFEVWLAAKYSYGHADFWAEYETIQRAFLIEWLREEVKIHVTVFPYGDKISWCYNLIDWIKDPDLYFNDRLSSLKIREGREFDRYGSYELATQAAIQKANEIYNGL